METLHGFPFLPIEFTKSGTIFKPEQRQAILTEMPANTTDIVVVSHGWNNDMADAQRLYDSLLTSMRAEMPPALAARRFAVVAVFWPSKRFADEELISGGGASFGEAQNELQRQLDDIEALLQRDTLPETERPVAATPPIEEAKALATNVEAEDERAAERLIELVRARVAEDTARAAENELTEDASNIFFTERPDVILANLATPAEGNGGEMEFGGGAAGGLGGVFRSVFDRTKDVMNFTTYYVMKTRAGEVGKNGVAPLLDELAARFGDARLHLVGHSFGGRVVTAAVANARNPVASLSLLQAAFSHNGFGDNENGLVGFFRNVVTQSRVRGPIVITHTRNDKAVGLVYAIASRLVGDRTSAVGDATDVFGGMGSNGAQHANAQTATLAAGFPLTSLQLSRGRIHNLLADAVVSGHSDVTNRDVARAVIAAIAS